MAVFVLGTVSYEPVNVAKTLKGGAGMPTIQRFPEKATQTFKQGVPLTVDVSGYIRETDFTADTLVYGFSAEPGHNLVTNGVAIDGYSEGAAQNQPSSKIIPPGAWMRDGKCGLYVTDSVPIFSIALKAGQTFTQALIIPGTLYGLTKDGTSGFWYLDNTDTTGNNAVADLLGMDSSSPNDGVNGTRVHFRIPTSKSGF